MEPQLLIKKLVQIEQQTKPPEPTTTKRPQSTSPGRTPAEGLQRHQDARRVDDESPLNPPNPTLRKDSPARSSRNGKGTQRV